MTVPAMRLVGAGLCALAVLRCVQDIIGHNATTRQSPGLVRRVTTRYDASRRGRRLGEALWRAQVDIAPWRWRCGQLAMAIPLGFLLTMAGMDPLPGIGLATTVVRTGTGVLLRLRRGRSRAATDAAAPVVARALAVEMAAWGSGTQAVLGAPRRCRATAAAARILDVAAARVALGGEPGPSLARAIAQLEPRLRPASPMLVVAAVFTLHRHDAAATAAALEHLATAIEDQAAVRREARAAVGEVRSSAVVVPAIAGVTAAILFASDPAALAAALSFPLLPMLGGALLMVVATATIARRAVAI